LILQEESGVTAVADPWAGSYMMEELTDSLEARALELIAEIDDLGGMTKVRAQHWRLVLLRLA
jgi:methylmalonyl-CoA mutase